ncbi:ABC transporter substrate-binding protein [Pseudoroseicyclus sp. H15]
MRTLTTYMGSAAVLLGSVAAGTAFAFSPPAQEITVALLEGGTATWEIEAMKSLHLDEKHGVEVEMRPVANTGAGQVALQGDRVDVILSDFLWTSVQRHEGSDFTFVPHSLAVGALMVMPDGPVQSVEDLPGSTIAIAGGPVDKSYVTLQAYYMAKFGEALPDQVTATFGAPPLVNEQLTSGDADAALNFWHFNARAKVEGAVELITVEEMLAELGVSETPPLLGWVFSESYAEENDDIIEGFLDASYETKQKLLTDDELWETIRPVMNVGDDDALFETLRDDYRAGIVTTYGPEAEEAAAQSFALMAEYGGSDLIGDNPEIAPGTFWDGYEGN